MLPSESISYFACYLYFARLKTNNIFCGCIFIPMAWLSSANFSSYLNPVVCMLQSIVLRGDASVTKLARLEEFSSYLRSRTEELNSRGEIETQSGDDETEDSCCICYNNNSDAFFEPCHHTSCFGCISRHLLNSQRCFFCNATVSAVVTVEPKGAQSR